jgi:uncharacterized membrane protein YhfC
MVVLGLAVGVFVSRRYRVDLGLFGAVAVVFIGSQVLHIPFNYYVLMPWLERSGILSGSELAISSVVPAGIVLGLSAGVFEEGARYIAYRYWQTRARRWREGLMLGAGHGGAEAVIIGLLGFATVARLVSLQGVDLASVVQPDQLELAQAQVAAFWAAPWYEVFLGVVERASAIVLHLSASLLVLQSVRRRELRWLLFAVAWHTFLNAAAIIGLQTWGVYAAEGMVVGVAVLSLFIIRWLRKSQQEPPVTEAQVEADLPAPVVNISEINIDQVDLEDTRYD